jgi:hypothetical protein
MEHVLHGNMFMSPILNLYCAYDKFSEIGLCRVTFPVGIDTSVKGRQGQKGSLATQESTTETHLKNQMAVLVHRTSFNKPWLI